MQSVMGLFAKLCINIESELTDFVQYVIDDIWKTGKVRPIGEVQDLNADEISFEAMTVSIRMSDEDDLEVLRAQYDMNLNCKLYIDIHQSIVDKYKQVMDFITIILHKFDGDCVFLMYDTELLLRRQGVIIVDRTQKQKYKDLPYENLPQPCMEDDIETEDDYENFLYT